MVDKIQCIKQKMRRYLSLQKSVLRFCKFLFRFLTINNIIKPLPFKLVGFSFFVNVSDKKIITGCKTQEINPAVKHPQAIQKT